MGNTRNDNDSLLNDDRRPETQAPPTTSGGNDNELLNDGNHDPAQATPPQHELPPAPDDDNDDALLDDGNPAETQATPPPRELPPAISHPLHSAEENDDYWTPEPSQDNRGGSAPPPRGPNTNWRPDVPSDPTGPLNQAAPMPVTAAQDPCTIIGAPDSGKTSLLFAIERACNLPGADRMNLRFMPEGEATVELLRKPVSLITEEDDQMQATAATRDYKFWVYVTAPSQYLLDGRVEESLEMVVRDGPGGAIFPRNVNLRRDRGNLSAVDRANLNEIEEWQSSLIPHSRVARALIFCVDATNPHLDLLEAYLQDFFSRISDVKTIEPARDSWPIRLANRLRGRQETGTGMHRRVLRVNRFLLLLTKVDQLCAHCDDPWAIAQMLDPVEQAYGLLGPAMLNRIYNALDVDEGAKFAVGVASAWGFDWESREPLANAEGKARTIGNETPGYILRRWRPFGVREALYFIATGRAEGTVKLVTPESIWIRERRDEIDVYPYKQTSESAN